MGGLLLLGLLASDPALGIVVLAVLAGAGTIVRQGSRLARCLHHCGAVSYQIGDSLRITVSRRITDDAA